MELDGLKPFPIDHGRFFFFSICLTKKQLGFLWNFMDLDGIPQLRAFGKRGGIEKRAFDKSMVP